MEDCDIEMSIEMMQSMPKEKFKEFIKNKCKEASFSALVEEKNKLSKGKEIKYTFNEEQEYLKSHNNLTFTFTCQIIRIRLRDLPLKKFFQMLILIKAVLFLNVIMKTIKHI